MSDFDRDSYRTPSYLFHWLNRRFHFDFDGCASEENALCQFYCSDDREGGFLTFDPFDCECDVFKPTSIFINPPYSNPTDFIKRAIWWKEYNRLVVMLLPADKTTEWFKLIEKHATEVIEIVGYHDEKGKWRTGRIQFIHPVTGKPTQGNNKGSMIVVFDPLVQGMVTRQVSLDFIKQWGK
ncbi:DNA N-6-adenine-methyltransferase [Bibersteinia trehalosi USDA-ARS-USMARC-189]|uniref:DNA N-6-adenine-methyltransferase n=2 Tax=Bibersteinia trehalosi TaxID=47735 RepID=W0RD85_BIBTR|nr:DNA N-6-adenine-methyltransferase [Bibersteinia trehalosi]AHG83067.1 DNA N-6-adenine-methyltransferase [Bibersteinia trehalosi USDA-ARS-USMARC-189]AHG87348.1 DNA N-6-adenine-methyltransferase [Bibersteinia trehalosi USDA-ARS-USMARC-190]